MAEYRPARNLEDAFISCDPDVPLLGNDPRYRDLSEGRGDKSVRSLARRFRFRSRDRYTHVAFLSHRGAGKTTELHRLDLQLMIRYHRIYFEANLELNPNQLETEDLLLSIALFVDEEMRKAELPLPTERVRAVESWFLEVIRSSKWGTALSGEIGTAAEAGGEVPLLAKLSVNLKALLRSESEYRTELREVLRRYPGALLDAVNTLLDAANEQLRGRNRELLIVIDNLDRYDPKMADALLVKGGPLLEKLRCHMIVTPPIGLLYRPLSETLETYFDIEVMHTIRLRRRTQPYDQFDGPGRQALLETLMKRVDLDRCIPDEVCRNRLLSASGGAVRDLFRLVREAILLASGEMLDREAVEGAVARIRREMRDRINLNDWAPALAKIAKTKQAHGDGACMEVLYHRLALKYNGDGWYDVHPLVAELDEFKSALAALPP
jgi:hypothetical protein